MRRFAFILAAAVLFGAATYTVTLQPGDSVTVTAPGTVVQPPPPAPTNTIPLGVNLTEPNDWDMSAFAKVSPDLMKFAREIAPNRWRVLTAGDINIQYEPGKWSTFGSKYPKVAGTYLLSYDGPSGVSASSAIVKNWINTNGKCTADVVVSRDDVNVDLQFAAPVTNIVLLRPGYPRGTPHTVTNEFKSFVAPFTFIRYMDAQDTNWHLPNAPSYWFDAAKGTQEYYAMRNKGMSGASFVANIPYARVNDQVLTVATPLTMMRWADRPNDTAQTFHRVHGVSPEWIVRVANETRKDMWFNLPVTFSDDYAVGLAQLVKDKLDPVIHVYMEYGNEMPWNDIPKFGQAQTVVALAKEALKTNPKLNEDGQNDWYMGTRYVLLRTIEAAKVFRTILGDAEFARRVHPIFASQHAECGYAGNALNWALRNSDLSMIEGLAIAPYVATSSGTVQEIQAKLRADFEARYQPMAKQSQWRAMADAYAPFMKAKTGKLYAYECGFNLGQGIPNLANRIGFALDAGTESIVRDYMASMYAGCGMDAACWFNGVSSRGQYTPAWGLTHDSEALTEPMYRAAAAFAIQPVSTGGVTATFYKNSTFTTPIATVVTPLVFHGYEAWKIGTVVGRSDIVGLLQTKVLDGAIRFTGRYTGTGTLRAECEANDSATLTRDGDKFRLDYVARFGGNGLAWVRLVDGAGVVRQSQLLPQ